MKAKLKLGYVKQERSFWQMQNGIFKWPFFALRWYILRAEHKKFIFN